MNLCRLIRVNSNIYNVSSEKSDKVYKRSKKIVDEKKLVQILPINGLTKKKKKKRKEYLAQILSRLNIFKRDRNLKSFRISQNARVENKSVNTVDDLSLTFVLLFIESSDRLLSCTCYDLIFEFLLRYVLLYNNDVCDKFRGLTNIDMFQTIRSRAVALNRTEIPLIRNLTSHRISSVSSRFS